jgi:ankyrin repeat protein
MTSVLSRYSPAYSPDKDPPLDDALFDAVKSNDAAALRARLEAGVPPDHPCGDADGMTPLMYAVDGGFHGCMRLLLEAGADANLRDGKKGFTPLRRAIMKQDAEAVKMLLEYGADPGWKCVRTDENNLAIGEPVTDEEIAKEGDPGIAAMVTEARKKFRVNELAHDNPADLSEMRRLLEAGVPVNIKNENSQTALMYACIHRNVAMTKLLLEFGADPEITWDPHVQTALRLACGSNRAPPSLPIVELLLEHGADPHRLDARGRSLVHSAASGGEESILKLVVQNGVSLTARDADGNTPADNAEVWNGNGDKAARLIKKVAAWNIEEIGRKATELDKPVKPMKPLSFGKKQ